MQKDSEPTLGYCTDSNLSVTKISRLSRVFQTIKKLSKSFSPLPCCLRPGAWLNKDGDGMKCLRWGFNSHEVGWWKGCPWFKVHPSLSPQQGHPRTPALLTSQFQSSCQTWTLEVRWHSESQVGTIWAGKSGEGFLAEPSSCFTCRCLKPRNFRDTLSEKRSFSDKP